MRLAGRTAFITGSSRGIGAATARRLAADGAAVVLHASKDPAKAEGVAESIRAAGGTAEIVLGDLTRGEVATEVVRDAFGVHRALDILVLNAGASLPGLAVEHTPASIDHIIALNLRAPIMSTIEFARLTNTEHGRVVFLSSGAATHPAYGQTIYSAAKAGTEAFIRSAAQEFGERGITLNTVAPGTTRTDMNTNLATPERIATFSALGRLGEPEDIADVIAFLVSDDARWVTGQTILANGGFITTASTLLTYSSRL
jgi:3-oxoacyl-[acyl-carrier protein] reductase